MTDLDSQPETPPESTLPPWRIVDLPGRGPLRIRDSGSPPGGGPATPVLFLLHGWTVSSDLNWCRVYSGLTERFRVVSWDQRGHGRHGLRQRKRFRLEDCADDAAAVIGQLDVQKAIAVGYSMGGAVAQLLWRRHPHMVSGLVLCATAMRFRQTIAEYRDFALIQLASRPAGLFPETAWHLAERVAAARAPAGSLIDAGFDRWASGEVRAGDLAQILGAGVALGGFDSSPWVGSVTIPTAVLVGVSDPVIPTARQRQLATALPQPFIIEFSGGHSAPVTRPEHFTEQLLTGIDTVAGG